MSSRDEPAREGLVYLVRHGAVLNPHGIRYGRLPGYGLSTEGVSQAKRAAAWLREYALRPVCVIVSSPLLRARETASLLRDELSLVGDIEYEPALTEVCSPFDGLARGAHPFAYARRLVATFPRCLTEWERSEAAAVRMRDAIREAAERSKREGCAVVLVSHQAPIWLARVALEHGYAGEQSSWIDRKTPWRYRAPSPGYASITELRVPTVGTPAARYVDPAA